jgi:hypothetical protein
MTLAQLGQHEGTSAVIDEPHQLNTKQNSSSKTKRNQEPSIVQQPPKQGSLEDTGTPSAVVSTDGTGNLKAQKNLRMSPAITITATTRNTSHSPRTSRTVRRSNHVTVDSGFSSTISTFATAEVQAAIVHGLARAWNKVKTEGGQDTCGSDSGSELLQQECRSPELAHIGVIVSVEKLQIADLVAPELPQATAQQRGAQHAPPTSAHERPVCHAPRARAKSPAGQFPARSLEPPNPWQLSLIRARSVFLHKMLMSCKRSAMGIAGMGTHLQTSSPWVQGAKYARDCDPMRPGGKFCRSPLNSNPNI